MPTLTVNDQQIYARIEGPPNGQVALLVHGWSSSWYALLPLLPTVSRRFRCVAVDLPGYGKSAAGAEPATIGGYAELLAGLARQLSDSPVVLIGHSMGGMISITMALRYPQLVERMVLLCPTISGRLSTYINLAISPITMLERSTVGATISRLIESQFMSLSDRLMRPASFAERSEVNSKDYERIRADVRRPGQGKVRAECFQAMRDGDLRGQLGQVETPTLVLWGAEDNTVPLRDAGVVDDEWPSADLRIIPKAGHWPQFESPERTLRAIAAFLGLPAGESRFDDTLSQTIDDVAAVAQFLAHSDVGYQLSLTQRTRLAAQFRRRVYPPRRQIVGAAEAGDQLFLVQDGSIEVVIDATLPDAPGRQRVAMLTPGQMAGELALLDGGRRSANLVAGAEGAVVLTLRRDRLEELIEEDPTIGSQVLWNIARALALRLRLTTWQHYNPPAERAVGKAS